MFDTLKSSECKLQVPFLMHANCLVAGLPAPVGAMLMFELIWTSSLTTVAFRGISPSIRMHKIETIHKPKYQTKCDKMTKLYRFIPIKISDFGIDLKPKPENIFHSYMCPPTISIQAYWSRSTHFGLVATDMHISIRIGGE